MFLSSVRFKIIPWYMFILTLTLLLFSFLLFHNLSRRLHQEIDNMLQLKAEGIADSIDAYWEAEQLEGEKEKIDISSLAKIDNANFAKAALRWVEEKSSDPALMNIAVQIFDRGGTLIASSRNIANISVIPERVFTLVSQGQSYFKDMSVNTATEKALNLRIFTLPVIENEKIVYIVQVSTGLNLVESSLRYFRVLLFFLLPGIVLATGVVGIYLAKIALSPVDKMIHTINQITAENLQMRVRPPNTKDEIRKLADTFNEMLEKLECSFTSQREFIEDLTHELKTPLSVIKGELEVALKKMRSKEEYGNILHSNLEEVNKIIRIVEDLLLLARFDNNAVVLLREPLDLNLLLKQIIEDIRILAEQKQITLSLSVQGELKVEGDSQKLRLLFLNMVDNAIKYTPPQGKVCITATREDKSAKITVTDTGVGISAENLPRIFDRFYRIDASRTHGGFGLGLSIAKSIAKAHQGAISAESTLHRGSTFTIIFPLLIHP